MPTAAETIRYRRIDSVEEVLSAQVLPEVFDHDVEPDKLAAHLASATHFLACAFDGDIMAGMIMANLHLHPDKPNELYIDEVGVAESHRQQGIAGRLMEKAIMWGRELGCTSCWVGTETDNLPAQALYRKWQPEAEDIKMFEFDL